MLKQLCAGFPVSLITIGGYGATAVSVLDFASEDFLFKAAAIGGNVIILGMLSKETFDKMLNGGPPDMTIGLAEFRDPGQVDRLSGMLAMPFVTRL